MIKLSETVRNARLNAIESAAGPSALLRMYSGSPPPSCADPATGTKLVEMLLPASWLGTAAAGKISLAGVWSGRSTGTGTVGYFRIVSEDGLTTHIQGVMGVDMPIDNPSLVPTQVVTVSRFNITDANG